MIGVLGGTFDPVHHGHLRFALEAVEALRLRSLKLVPARVPPHRPALFIINYLHIYMINTFVNT